ncbi:hypothetical protein [Brevibacterium oceani]|uniref:hypothetical protein n=1 Tax=Brevibacterium oceani TaxID=358099 RepID=UPI001B33C3E6|nr:hypothetical protein [Brevibacterium oceani]
MGREHSTTDAGSSDGIGRGLGLVAQALPWGAVACWVITIFVPVLDSGEPDSLRIRVTSLGFSPIDMNDLDEVYLLLWVVIIVGAVTAWLMRASKWWSVAAIVLGTGLGLRMLQMVVDPPYLLWDGQTANGMPTGGMEIAYPAAGFVFWIAGSLCFLAAGICGLIAQARRTRERRDRIRRCMKKNHGSAV